MKRTIAVGLLCSAMLLTATSPVQSLSKPSYSDADTAAIATALNAYNRADTSYNTALSVYNTANAAYVAAKANLDNTKAVFDAAVIENSAAASALTTAITDANAATKYMEDCRLLYFCPSSVYTAAVNDWYAKTAVYFAARDRQNASLTSFNSSRDAYNAAIPLYNATVAPNNSAANALQNAIAVKTAAYNLYVETKATADRNDTTKFIPPKITAPKTVTSTTINAPLIVITKKGLQTPAKKFKNCTELRKTFPKGVAKDKKSAGKTGATVNAKVYKLNIGSDRDKNGVACELA
jgi:hypothetical protein